MIRSHFNIAWRKITQNKLVTIINVAGLSLGICACIVIFLVTKYELSFDKFHPDYERIYLVGSKNSFDEKNSGDVPPPVPMALSKEATGLESVSGYFRVYDPAITISGQKMDEKLGRSYNNVIIAGPEYFSIFKYDWLIGNPDGALKDPFKVVLTEDRARKYFGISDLTKVIGREIIYNDTLRLSVSGIIRDWTGNSDFAYSDFISFSTLSNSFLRNSRHLNDWTLQKGGGQFYWPVCFVKLARNISVSHFNSELNELAISHMGREKAKHFSMRLEPLSDLHFNPEYADENTRTAHLPTLYSLMAVSFLILLIAAINFVNLSTAQSMERAKEISLRKILGGSRKSLVFQFLTETFLICTLATVMATIMTKPVLRLFTDFIPRGVRFDLFNPFTLSFLLGITLITSALAGLYPAKLASRFLPIVTLKGNGVLEGINKWWFRRVLIIFQFSLSLIFIISAIVIERQIEYMLDSDFGFKTNEIVTINNWTWQDDLNKTKVFEERVRQVPGIEKAILEFTPPMSWGKNTAAAIYKGKNVVKQDVSFKSGNEDYILFYQMKLMAGRNLIHNDSLTEIVVNETCARAFGFASPDDAVGKFLYINDKSLPVVGVVSDFHTGSFKDLIGPIVIGHNPFIERSIGLKMVSQGKSVANMQETLLNIQKIWKEVFPDKEFIYSFLNQYVTDFYESEIRTSKLVKASMAVAIFISCIGLFGLVIFTTEKRAKEIGIRKVLGASVWSISGLLTKEFFILVLISFFIASPVSWIIMNKWLQNYAYHIPISGWIFLGAGSLVILITSITVSYKTIKSASANPVVSLRTD